MKKTLKNIFIATILLGTITSCTQDDDYTIPNEGIAIYTEDFNTATNNTNFDFTDWYNYAEEGTWIWREKSFTSNGVTNGYAEFSAFGSNSNVNLVWLVSPELNLDLTERNGVSFKIAQHHLDKNSILNSLKVMITNNFDNQNPTNTIWTELNANIPNKETSWYEFLQSNISLSNYSGKVRIGFRFMGSGNDQDYDGAFQIDDFIFYKK